ncbi:MAG: DMT family transporter [Firmicutes bacterium]|nr:DMT family transporter [Bacillota bacterium]
MKGYYHIALAALFWGTLGLFAKLLLDLGVTSEEVAFLRLLFGAVALLIYLLIKKPALLKINLKGLMVTFCMGLITQTGFNYAYFNAVRINGVAIAAVLLYLAPAILLVLSMAIYHEKMTLSKGLGIILCIMGSYLAVTGGRLDFSSISAMGVMFGLLAAFAYALMSVMSKKAITLYPQMTLIFYSFVFGMIFMMPFIDFGHIVNMMKVPQHLGLAVALGVVPSAMAYVFYFRGIALGAELSKAGIISLLELVVSVVFAIAFFAERLTVIKSIGLCLILFAIVVINIKDGLSMKAQEFKVSDLK